MRNRLLRKVREVRDRVVLSILFPVEQKAVGANYGVGYGSWWVPETGFVDDGIVVSVGAGEDLSFEHALLDRFDPARLLVLDPTPRAIAHFATESFPGCVSYHPIGLSDSDGSIAFYAPSDPRFVSHSAENLSHTGIVGFNAEVVCLATLCRQQGIGAIDLLKLDIEGSEHRVIESLSALASVPKVVCVEIDAVWPLARLRLTRRRLKNLGFVIVNRDGRNVTLCATTQCADKK